MHSRASQLLNRAFQERGFQARLAERTGISQTRLSRLAQGETTPNLEHSLKLKADPEVAIDPTWWSAPPVADTAAKRPRKAG